MLMRIASRRMASAVSSATILALLCLAVPAWAQKQPSEFSPPRVSQSEQPAAAAQGDKPTPAGPGKHGRIFGIIPNYAAAEVGSHPPPLTSRAKFIIAAKISSDPYAFAVVGLTAGIGQAENSDPSWGQGLAGYGKRYASALATQTIGNFLSGAVLPSLLRQDPRYYRLGKGSITHRFEYSLSRLAVTRSDSGHRQFNYSAIVGNVSAAGISNLYRAHEERTVSATLTTAGTQFALALFGNELREFWPDIQRKLFRRGN